MSDVLSAARTEEARLGEVIAKEYRRLFAVRQFICNYEFLSDPANDGKPLPPTSPVDDILSFIREEKSPPETTPPAKTESDRRSGDAGGHPIQPDHFADAGSTVTAAQTVPAMPVPFLVAEHEAVESSATHSPETAHEYAPEASDPQSIEGIKVADDANPGGQNANGASESGAPFQESVPVLQRAASEASPSSDESATGREAGDALPATNLPETANETVGGLPVAAAPTNAEETGRNPAYAQGAGVERGIDQGVTGGESAATGEADAPRDREAASPAPTKRERVRLLHEEHPDWSAVDIAVALNLSRSAVNGHLSLLGISLGVKGEGLGDRIAALHDEHPEWTAADMARALDARSGSVANAMKRRGIVLPKAHSGRDRKPDSVTSRVEAYHRDHPDATAGEIAIALEVDPSAVRAAAVTRNLTLRRLTHEERSARQRVAYEAFIANERAQEPGSPPETKPEASPTKYVRPSAPAVVAKPAPEDDGAESRHRKYGEEPAGEPENAPSATPEENYVHPSVAKFGSPSAKWFRLRRKDGAWLHMSGTGFTTVKNDGWIGRIGQLRAIRSNAAYPDAQGLQIVGVTVAPK